MRDQFENKEEARRFNFLCFVGIILIILLSRLFFLQIITGEKNVEFALQNSLKRNIIKAPRGQIYDKEGRLLAQNMTGYKLVSKETPKLPVEEKVLLEELVRKTSSEVELELEDMKPVKQKRVKRLYENIKLINNLTELSYDEIIKKYFTEEPYGFDKTIVIMDDMDKEMAMRTVEKLSEFTDLNIVEYNKRHYPQDYIGSHLIGYVKPISKKEYEDLKDGGYRKDDLIGKEGVEKEYDKVMKGKDGSENVEVDARGNIVNKLYEEETVAGENLYLSIDLDLQKYMTEQFKNKSGVFIAMEAKTGKIIAYVSNPEISLNLLSSRIPNEEWEALVNSEEKPLLNKGIAGLYPPGSTFKVVIGMGILEGGISPSETVYSTGAYKYGRTTFRDSHSGGHGSTNFAKSIGQSVNTYYYVLSQKVGKEQIIKTANEFGIGQKTEIDIPGEKAGVLPSPEWKNKTFKTKEDKIWKPGDLINMSIGQGYVLTTPIQMLQVYQGVANNGIIYKPTFVDRFVSYDGKVREKKPEELKRLNFSKTNLDLVKESLKLPVTGPGGTAKILYFKDYPVSVKTGTSQTSGYRNSGYKGHHSWMAGFFPSDNPEIIFVSIVENGGFGSVASGSIVKAFIVKYREKYEMKKDISKELKTDQPLVEKGKISTITN